MDHATWRKMSSRIIVKNLPKVITRERVEKHFSNFGQVTDVKLVHTPSGLFRRFAFIGYHDEAQADKAVKYFDKTFIESCRIDVDLAKPYGDKEIPRTWSQHSKTLPSSTKTHDEEKSDKQDENLEKEYAQRLNQTVHKSKLASYLGELYELDTDPEFAEFLSLHKSKTSSKAWANDDGLMTEKMEEMSHATKQKVKPSIVSVESRRPGGKGILLTRTHLKFDKEEDDSQHSMEETVLSTDKVLSDMDYLKLKIVNEREELEDVNMKEGVVSCEEDTANTENIKEINEGEEPMEEATPTKNPFTLKMRGVPYKSKSKAIRAFFYPLELLDIRMVSDQAGKPTGIAFVDFRNKQDMLDGFSRNRDCMGRRYIELFKEEPLEKKNGNSSKPRPWESKEAELKEIEPIGESGRLFIRNLSYSITEDELTQLFEKYGPLAEVLLPLDKTTNRPIGLGFVTYVLPENAVKAFSELDGQIFHGRLLHILPSKPPVTPQTTKLEPTSSTSTSSYKKSKQSLLKEKSGSAHNWNSLFLGSNAIADSMADRYNVEKSDLLDAEGNQSLAVRLALGETQLVSETREFLENQGVVLSVFNEAKPKRSKSVILVKNLAFGTSEEELKELFEPFGLPARIILPPGGISALIEFSQASVAKKAFKKLAYSEFKDLPIYLEWAPCGVFEANDSNGKTETIVEEESMGQGSTVFVKNLNFKSNEESLDKFFSTVGKVKKSVVARKANMRDPGNPLSMGYGFIEYEREEDALKAIKRLQGHELDDHKLELKLSRAKNQPRTTKEKSSKPEQQVSSKLLVRNIPFETGKKEIMQLFGTFGKLKNVRLPLKMGSSSEHRGFCFVEFVTKEDAKRAFDSLRHSTHLYGRRLVLEWAALEESVSSIRAKTSRYFSTSDTAETSIAKKRKLGKELLKTLDCTV